MDPRLGERDMRQRAPPEGILESHHDIVELEVRGALAAAVVRASRCNHHLAVAWPSRDVGEAVASSVSDSDRELSGVIPRKEDPRKTHMTCQQFRN